MTWKQKRILTHTHRNTHTPCSVCINITCMHTILGMTTWCFVNQLKEKRSNEFERETKMGTWWVWAGGEESRKIA